MAFQLRRSRRDLDNTRKCSDPVQASERSDGRSSPKRLIVSPGGGLERRQQAD